jgi:two-component system cell cycle response regulator DivK
MLNDHNYLYVEDDPLSCEVMQMIMQEAMGIERLTILHDSENFMESVKKLPLLPDIILLDIHMQPVDGFHLLALLRADSAFQSARIVALTASVMTEEVEQLREAGFDGVIAKPLSVMTFPGLLERILRGEAVWQIV